MVIQYRYRNTYVNLEPVSKESYFDFFSPSLLFSRYYSLTPTSNGLISTKWNV